MDVVDGTHQFDGHEFGSRLQALVMDRGSLAQSMGSQESDLVQLTELN